MKTRLRSRLLHRLLMAGLILVAAGAVAADEATMLNRKDLKWGDAPPALPKGAKLTVLYGDPFKPGPYAMRDVSAGLRRAAALSHQG